MDAAPLDCANCGTPLADRFCAHCGQRAVALRPTFHELLHEAVHEAAHVDGKLLKTARLLVTAPGRLTRDFIEGKRARYITPIRLYLICTVIFFAVVAFLPSNRIRVTMGPTASANLRHGAAVVNRNPALLAESFRHNVPRAAFVLMPVMGAIIFLFYRRAEPTYTPHLYFAVHYHAFVFLLMTAAAILMAFNSLWTWLAAVLLFLATLPYLIVALRTVYGGSFLAATSRGIVIWAVHGVLVLAVVLGVMFLAVYEAAH